MSWKKEYNCGVLRGKDKGKKVSLVGWVDRIRDLGGVIFITLRDRHGKVQISVPQEKKKLHKKAQEVGLHYVIGVRGKVHKRPEKDINPEMETGEIEVTAEELEVLNTSEPLPLSIDDRDKVSEDVRMKYRYLDLHRNSMQKALELRHRICLGVRKYLDSLGFMEIETPVLTKSTPEGARDYLVPSRVHQGKFYALPQSPQLFKQLLMVGGVEKYFQICRCFRDEDLRADRQPEFTQIDMEMSFVDQDDIFEVTEGMFQQIFKDGLGADLTTPFLRLTHRESVERFGTDKPDLRFGMELQDLSAIAKKSDFQVFKNVLEAGGMIKAIVVEGAEGEFSRKKLDDLTSFAGDHGAKGLAWMKVQEGKIQSPIVKFFSEKLQKELRGKLKAKQGDLILIVAGPSGRVHTALGALRNKVASDLNLKNPEEFKFLWITDFPLFTFNDEEDRFDSEHHPFTAPHPEDLKFLDSDPLKVRAQSYDLVLNGIELGSGSIRIHRREIQQKIFDLLKLNPEEIEARFGFFLKALSYGAPPHGGIAPGLDRIVMLLAGYNDIREVIAFPKTAKATCLMTESPSEVGARQLEELALKITKKPEQKS